VCILLANLFVCVFYWLTCLDPLFSCSHRLLNYLTMSVH